MDQDTNQRLHDVDLRQIERLRKLAHRLAADLSHYDGYTQSIAQQESRHDMERAGLTVVPADVNDSASSLIEDLERRQVKVLLSLKNAVWTTSNNLNGDHQHGKVIKAQVKEQAELVEEQADG